MDIDLDALDALAEQLAEDDRDCPDGPGCRDHDVSLDPATVRTLIGWARLGQAWEAAEAVLPDGWGFAVAFTNRYRADAWLGKTGAQAQTEGPTHAAALLALAAKLAEPR